MKMVFAMLAFAAALSAAGAKDHTIRQFPRLAGETDDAPRFQRAVDACRGGGVLMVPSGDYTFAKTLFVTNLCSVELFAGARIKAVAEMEWMVKIDQMWQYDPQTAPKDVNPEVYNLSWRGGTLDADGKASCLAVDNYRHFTLENATFLNGRRYGVGIETTGRGYEMVARNLYFKTLVVGLAGNTALYSKSGDSHYTDIIAVDYTTGVHFAGDGANWLTRIHVWGGLVGHPAKPGELPEMLRNSVCFRIDAPSVFLRDCYADTGAICYWINGWECRMDGCYSFNNPSFGLNDVVTIRQDKGTLWCDNCMFNRITPETRLYQGSADAKIAWGDNNIFRYFWKEPKRRLPPSREPATWQGDVDASSCRLTPCSGEAHVKGSLNHPERVMKVSRNLEVAFDFLRTHDLKSLPAGKIEVDGDNVFAFVSTPVLKPFDDPGGLVEVHRRYIDIHVPVEGVETIGCLDIDSLPDGVQFKEKDDYALFPAKTVPVTVKPGEFIAFFPPRGAHRPACTMDAAAETNALRKICVKVKHLQD